jgi:aldose 1-epimerase
MITLESGRLRLALLPERGASIASFHDGDFPLLRETPPDAIAARDVREFSCFPLIPYSNRIRHAQFTFAGRAYALRHDQEDPRHAMHGTARFHPWRLVEHSASSATCDFSFPGHNDEWPFPYHAWQVFALEDDRLVIEIGMRNTHSHSAPAGLGLHPYFLRHGGVTLQFNASYVWEKDSEDIPIRSIPDAGKFNFIAGHAISASDLIDHAYGEWDQRAVLAWPAHNRRLRIEADSIFQDVVVYTPSGREDFAAEPVTHWPDALNPNGDKNDANMAILPPGGTLRGRVAFILS